MEKWIPLTDKETGASTADLVMLKRREQVQNGVTYAKLLVTKPDLIIASAFPEMVS